MGNIVIKVIDVVVNKDSTKSLPEYERTSVETKGENVAAADPNNICRFCLGGFENESNPLVSPCNCCGSIKYVHINCLKEFYCTKGLVVPDEDSAVSILTRTLTCQLCKATLKGIFSAIISLKTVIEEYNRSGKVYSLFQRKPAGKTYLILHVTELGNSGSDATVSVSFSGKNVISIGRGKSNDVRINSPTISRHHAILKLHNSSKVILQDLSSRYGTLIKVEAPIPVPMKQYQTLQVGNSLIWVKSKKNGSFLRRFMCCMAGENNVREVIPSSPSARPCSSQEVDDITRRFVICLSKSMRLNYRIGADR